ncbi:DUF2125 domain-containing protein [Aureimonas psammosilenae]|uniref:DUF2125 domain-containing protein n=1 Tax=Aureimonas psammosilenae TaxID=2495496 RepID=UPI00126062A7|nr:DUF2125 domain-containing protein [Aureimonas psammosilenae]
MHSTRRLLLALMLSAATLAPAWAEPNAPEPAPAGTQAQADEMTKALSAYAGSAGAGTGLLSVIPDPAGYRLRLDFAGLLRKTLPEGTKFDLRPFEAVVSPREDGNWNVFSNSDPSATFAIDQEEMKQNGSYAAEGSRFKGVWSTALAAFLSSEGAIRRFRSETTDALGKSTSEFGPLTFALTGTPVADGAVDLTVNQVVEAFSERREFGGEGNPLTGMTPFTVHGGKTDTVARIAAMRSKAITDLYAFLVANPVLFSEQPDRAALGALQTDLKAKLKAALPLWERLESSAKGETMSGEGGFGTFTVGPYSYDLATTGISKDGTLKASLRATGIDVVSPMVPVWAKSLIPQEMDLNFGFEKLDLRTPADIMIDGFDLTRDDTPYDELGRQAGEALEAAAPTVVIAPSRLKSADLGLSFSGGLVMTSGKPSASISMEATGFDATIEKLKTAAATSPDANQAVGVMSIAKGFGQALPDGRTQWVVNVATDGSVKVNGVEVKGPDPVVAPGEDPEGHGPDEDIVPDEGIAPDGDVPTDQAPTDDNALPEEAPQP